MCLAVPGKILDIKDDKIHATIDYGNGTKRKINISLVKCKKGDYVLVHAGFAIEIISKEEAIETLQIFREILEMEEEI